MMAQRHMHQYGTTREQIAWVKVAASEHAKHNPHALLNKAVSVEDVVTSPIISDPLRRLDCCVITDGGGALVLTSPEIAKSLKRPMIGVRGCGQTIHTNNGGNVDLTRTGAEVSAPPPSALPALNLRTSNMRRSTITSPLWC